MNESAGTDGLVRELKESRTKFTYFLLATTGAALGFVVQKLDAVSLDFPLFWWKCALSALIGSFVAGCALVLCRQDLLGIAIQWRDAEEEKDVNACDAKRKKYRRLTLLRKFLEQLQPHLLMAGVLAFTYWRMQLLVSPFYASPCTP